MVRKMYQAEGAPEKWLDSAFIHIVLGAVIGARLGHVFFYDWDYYKEHLIEIPQTWHGGLASHGGAFGIFFQEMCRKNQWSGCSIKLRCPQPSQDSLYVWGI